MFPNRLEDSIMKKSTYGLLGAAIGAALLASLPAGAADPSVWLQRQLTTDHRDIDAMPVATTTAARQPDGAGHAFAEAWLERQLAGKSLDAGRLEGVAGRAGPADVEESATPLSEAWLRHQFTTDHRGPTTQ